MMDKESLYQVIKNQICDRIFDGAYTDGDKLPPERELAETLGVSRVTIRKSLELLEEEGLVVREVGRGTRVSLQNSGNVSDMDMIVLIAPAKNPFFSKFIAQFQTYAEQESSMLLYVEKPKKEELEHCLYRLYKRGLRNVVVWLEDLSVNPDKLMRLRAIGMNMVFFDSNLGLPYGDCVAVDNQKAITALYQILQKKGMSTVGYVGWDAKQVYSIAQREQTYEHLVGEMGQKSLCCHISWRDSNKSRQIVKEQLAQWKMDGIFPDGLLCGDRETGQLVCDVIAQEGYDLVIASMDEVERTDRKVIGFKQDLYGIVRRIFRCLQNQSIQKEAWKPRLYLTEGTLEDTTES